MFVSTISRARLEDRLDPAFYAPLPLEADEWLASFDDSSISSLGNLAAFHASAFYKGIADRYGAEGIPFIRVGDVRLGTVSLARSVFLPDAVARGTKGLTTGEHPMVAITKGGSVGRVGMTTVEQVYAISRDVIALRPTDLRNLGLILFFLASVPGRAQVLRGASRQVQAHLTLERLRDVRIPKVDAAGIEALAQATATLAERRTDFDAQRRAIDEAVSSIDPFADAQMHGISYAVPRSDALRVRLDAAFYRPGFQVAEQRARAAGWESLGDVRWLTWPEDRWDRGSEDPAAWIDYIPLAAIEPLSVWAAPSRASWNIKTHDVLVPSLLDCLDRVGLVGDQQNGGVCSSGFYVLRPEDAHQALFVAAYLSSAGAKTQIERAGSGTRFRGITHERVAAVLIPPLNALPDLPSLMGKVQASATALQNAWLDGIDVVHRFLGWTGARHDSLVVHEEEVVENGAVLHDDQD